MDLYVMRHAETDENQKRIMAGQTIDTGLNENGKKQAEEVALELRNNDFLAIYSSTLKRSIETAEIINQYHNKDIFKRDVLREVDTGTSTGLSYDCISRDRFNKSLFFRFPEGESHADLIARIYPYLDKVKRDYLDSVTLLIVTHGEICKTIHSYFNYMSNREFSEMEWKNCEYRKYIL